MDLNLNDKVAIVTGGSDGIGKAAAISLANEGAKVAIIARNQEKIDLSVKEISETTNGNIIGKVGAWLFFVSGLLIAVVPLWFNPND